MSDMKFRLVVNRTSKKSIMTPEFRSIVELDKEVNLSGTIEVLGVKETNGNIQVTMRPYYESVEEKTLREKKYKTRPLRKRK